MVKLIERLEAVREGLSATGPVATAVSRSLRRAASLLGRDDYDKIPEFCDARIRGHLRSAIIGLEVDGEREEVNEVRDILSDVKSGVWRERGDDGRDN